MIILARHDASYGHEKHEDLAAGEAKEYPEVEPGLGGPGIARSIRVAMVKDIRFFAEVLDVRILMLSSGCGDHQLN